MSWENKPCIKKPPLSTWSMKIDMIYMIVKFFVLILIQWLEAHCHRHWRAETRNSWWYKLIYDPINSTEQHVECLMSSRTWCLHQVVPFSIPWMSYATKCNFDLISHSSIRRMFQFIHCKKAVVLSKWLSTLSSK